MSSLSAKMADLYGLERRARQVMGVAASCVAIVGLSFEAGLVRTAPSYERQSWYVVREHAGFIVTSEVADEAACRKREERSSTCHSGASMQAKPASGQR